MWLALITNTFLNWRRSPLVTLWSKFLENAYPKWHFQQLTPFEFSLTRIWWYLNCQAVIKLGLNSLFQFWKPSYLGLMMRFSRCICPILPNPKSAILVLIFLDNSLTFWYLREKFKISTLLLYRALLLHPQRLWISIRWHQDRIMRTWVLTSHLFKISDNWAYNKL